MKKYLPLIILTPLIIGLDQLSKYWVQLKLHLGEKIEVLPGYFDLVHYRNPGAAFGMFSTWDSPWRDYFFYALSMVAFLVLLSLYQKSQNNERRLQIPLALILGGALGNVIDRMHYGEVIDFLRVHWHNKQTSLNLLGRDIELTLIWPAFNVADSAITVGALWLAIVLLFFQKKEVIKNS